MSPVPVPVWDSPLEALAAARRPIPAKLCKQKAGKYWYCEDTTVAGVLDQVTGGVWDEQKTVSVPVPCRQGERVGYSASATSTITMRLGLADGSTVTLTRSGNGGAFNEDPHAACAGAGTLAFRKAASGFGIAGELYDEHSGRHQELAFIKQTLPAMSADRCRDWLRQNAPVADDTDPAAREQFLANASLGALQRAVVKVIEERRGVQS